MENPNATTQELALKTLDYFHEQGLYTATENANGSVSVVQTTITDEQYNNARGVINRLNDNGRTPAEQSNIDNEHRGERVHE